jgi:hypothetical protein
MPETGGGKAKGRGAKIESRDGRIECCLRCMDNGPKAGIEDDEASSPDGKRRGHIRSSSPAICRIIRPTSLLRGIIAEPEGRQQQRDTHPAGDAGLLTRTILPNAELIHGLSPLRTAC